MFLTGYERIGDDTFLLTGQWPRAHTFFISADGTGHDLVQVGETVRQAGLLLCHAEYGVPLGHNVLLWSLGFKADLEQLLIGAGPTDLELIATCRDFGWKGNRFSGFLEVSVRRDGRIAATGSGLFSFVPPAVYRRLRGEYGSLSTAAPRSSRRVRRRSGRRRRAGCCPSTWCSPRATGPAVGCSRRT